MTNNLEQRAAQLREIVNRPTEREQAVAELMQVEVELAEQERAEGQAAAEKRMVAVKRAHGSLLDQYTQDKARLRQAVAAVSEAVGSLNQRWRRLVELELEAKELHVGHGIAHPALTRVLPPAETCSTESDGELFTTVHERRFRSAYTAAKERGDAAPIATAAKAIP